MEAFLWMYPWDLIDEGVDSALGRIAGEVGADAVSVATTYHSVAQIRPHAGVTPTRFVSDAGAHFQPDSSCYGSTRLRPIAAAWMKSRNPVEKVGEGCRRRGLRLRAWTVCCHGSAMAARYPEAACKDAFEGQSTSWLCPGNPDVREYVAGLVADLTKNYPLAAIELEAADFGSGWHSHAHEKCGLAIGPVERLLMSLCFCESCIQSATDAGIDADAAKQSVREKLGPTLAGRPARAGTSDAFLADDEALRAYVAHRGRMVRTLIAAARQKSSVPVLVHAARDAALAALDPAQISGVCDGFILPGWQEPED